MAIVGFSGRPKMPHHYLRNFGPEASPNRLSELKLDVVLFQIAIMFGMPGMIGAGHVHDHSWDTRIPKMIENHQHTSISARFPQIFICCSGAFYKNFPLNRLGLNQFKLKSEKLIGKLMTNYCFACAPNMLRYEKFNLLAKKARYTMAREEVEAEEWQPVINDSILLNEMIMVMRRILQLTWPLPTNLSIFFPRWFIPNLLDGELTQHFKLKADGNFERKFNVHVPGELPLCVFGPVSTLFIILERFYIKHARLCFSSVGTKAARPDIEAYSSTEKV